MVQIGALHSVVPIPLYYMQPKDTTVKVSLITADTEHDLYFKWKSIGSHVCCL